MLTLLTKDLTQELYCVAGIDLSGRSAGVWEGMQRRGG